jgi:hypothetical protein
VQIVLNSKFFSTLSVRALAAKAQGLGFDGIDVNVRPGHPVTPDNVATALQRQSRCGRSGGWSVHWQPHR